MASTMIGAAGRRTSSSPNTYTVPMPSTTPHKANSKPSSSRNTTNNNTPRGRDARSHTTSTSTATSPSLKAQAKPRKAASNQRAALAMDDSDSDLTPQSSDNDDDDFKMQVDKLTPRKGKKHDVTPKSAAAAAAAADKKGKGKGKDKQQQDTTPKAKEKKTVTTTGPGGRVRKKAIKLEDNERRRARDAKFNVEGNLAMASSQTLPSRHDNDDAGSFGDDESDPGKTKGGQDDIMSGLPEALAGQDIEDLAYGAGATDFHLEQGGFGTGWWSSSDDEDEEEDGIYIDHLSGSEDDRQSVSTSNDNQSDVMMSESDDFSSSSEDEQVDEFGFPLHPVAPLDPMGPPDRPLILMENWKGELELVQPRQDRSRSRRGDRGSASRTAGSIGDSTVVSGDQELRIDPDEDCSDVSSWSGLSDEEDNGGDTTDSMAEEDMPMLDSPALQQLIGEQIGHLDVNSIPSPVEPLAPSIIVTDTSLPPVLPETPALSTTSSTPNLPLPAPASPSTPGSAPPATATAAQPLMGTFHPMTDDPAQCAVIDGSKSSTKSPFTHKRRDPRQRKNSIASSSRSLPERKRKSSMDIFSPNVVASPKIAKLPKKARYSSIPGHPRYVRAQRAAEAEDGERATTPSDSEAADQDMILSLEDMIETSVLVHENATDDEHMSHLIRFDRVPVSTYLRRNIMSSANRADDLAHHPSSGGQYAHHQAYSSPVGLGRGYGGMGDTLAGPVNGRGMLVSPLLTPVGEDDDESNTTSRKERRKAKRRGIMPPPLQL